MAFFSSNDPEDVQKMRMMFGPHQVDLGIRQAISICWMMLPDDKRNYETVAAEIRRVVERALASLKEDGKAFGITDEQ